MEFFYAIAALASSLAAVLAWAAKLWWGKEFAKSKDESIKAKDAQIALLEREIKQLQEMTPMKLREYFLSVREQLEEYNDKLNDELNEARHEIEVKQDKISQLQSIHSKKEDEIEKLLQEKTALEEASNNLEKILISIQENILDTDKHYNFININYEQLDDVRILHSNLRKFLSKTYITDFEINNKYNNYFIPATSIKGMLRSYLETFARNKNYEDEKKDLSNQFVDPRDGKTKS